MPQETQHGMGTDAYWDNLAAQQRAAAEKAQQEYTASHAVSRDDFLKKYGETFVANDKGGNAASEVAGQNVGEYYDRYLAPGAKPVVTSGIEGNDGYTESPVSFGYKYRDAMPYFDAYDNVNPHPESQDLGGVGEFWRQIGRPVAAGAAMYYGGNMLGNALGGTGAASAGSTAGGGAMGAGADFGAGTYAAEAAPELAAVGGPGTAGWGADLALPEAIETVGNADKAALFSNAGYGEAYKPGLWDQAKALVKDIPIKKAAGVLQMLGGAGGQQQASAQASPLAAYTPQQTVQPYDWQKIQNAANRAGVSMSEYVAQNQKYLNAGLYP